jgi:sec-independent protein translocase protein TatA
VSREEENMPFGLQPIHLVVIVIVALVIFGPKRLPQIGRWIGRTFMEFRKGARDMTDGFKEEVVKTGAEESPTAGRGTVPGGTSPGETAAPGASASATAASSSSAHAPSPSSTSPYPETAGNYCTRCGASNALDALFCNKCGNKLPV